MLNDIRFHLHESDLEQAQVETSIAAKLQLQRHRNIEALKRNIPSLVPIAVNALVGSSTIFCNKFGRINICDTNSGQVVYGLNPEKDAKDQVTAALLKPFNVTLNSSKSDNQLLVILGLGLGHHLSLAIEQSLATHIVVYEPHEDYFKCSMSSIDWQGLFQVAKKKNISLFFQVGKDARNLYHDIEELLDYIEVSYFTLIKHLNHPVFDEIQNILTTCSWEDMKVFQPASKRNDFASFLPSWTTFRYEKTWKPLASDNETYISNLRILKEYFPALYTEFLDYEISDWQPVVDNNGYINLCHLKTGALFYSINPKDEAVERFNYFTRYPQKDGLILGYKGQKLKHYQHYQFVKSCDPELNKLDNQVGSLPDSVKSLIYFGLGTGHELSMLVENYTISKLFICEPNRDFFYASLFNVDWAEVIKSFDAEDKRLYLNIGDDGTNLTKDLLVQFQSIGPYVLASTYFYQGYYNELLVKAVSQLREQLQVIIAMGDYFDNAKYGIAHTRIAIKSDIPFLKHDASQFLSIDDKDIPVFIVGNGPSLDDLIELIKVEKENAIVVSCGTALQSLYNHGIVPDFHAEIETNRTSFDWAMRIGDLDYLSKISLISCNGIHPDTCSLYGKTFLAFKQGEASTVSITELYKTHNFALLDHSYPTVCNFVVDFFTNIGMRQLYFLGTDLGFVDERHHHSKQSGYYDSSGSELYNYAEKNDTSIVVAGNFRALVKTKLEFKMSKTVIETTLNASRVEAYNLSDGAKIVGATPLKKHNVLLIKPRGASKLKTLMNLKTKAFQPISKEDFDRLYNERYSYKTLLRELDELIDKIPEYVELRDDVEALVKYQRDKLVASLLNKKSLLFYYFNGTINYTNSVLSKILNITDDDTVVDASNAVLCNWLQSIKNMRDVIYYDELGPDGSSTFGGKRRALSLTHYNEKIGAVVNVNNRDIYKFDYTFLSTFSNTSSDEKLAFHIDFYDQIEPHGDYHCSVIDFTLTDLILLLNTQGNFVYLPLSEAENKDGVYYQDHIRVNSALFILASNLRNVVAIPKPNYIDDSHIALPEEIEKASRSCFVYDTPFFIILSSTQIEEQDRVLGCGDRLVYVPLLTVRNYLGKKVTSDDYVKLYEGK
ncbi:DUF115 domain-containing protein [Alteromonas stellipolaris]|uniref:motility associated factor glycosyltransferase family protein n=1 Tax=Alteromonas stellipolaris TaxID=233316 RepID=UPI0021183165|nr:6-hydroxymethylpterin diphosphokinase MptE-like protein [Alteromonas stellipolaris]MCQ8849613.1 DUF115 domain-containing protein [Alteromonas stellipolaris]